MAQVCLELGLRGLFGFDRLVGVGDGRADSLSNDFAKEFFFAREIQIDRSLGNSGACGDLLEFRRVDAVLREDAERGVENLLRTLFGKPAPARVV